MPGDAERMRSYLFLDDLARFATQPYAQSRAWVTLPSPPLSSRGLKAACYEPA